MTSTCPAPDPTLNHRPIIGIVSHPGDGASGRLSNATNASYIAASYVKFVESAGARQHLTMGKNRPGFNNISSNKLKLVNGVLFTGGWSKSGLYFDVIEGIFKQVLKKNDAGEHFPLLAICLGFELLTMIISQNNNILEDFSASDQASTLQFMNNINLEQTLFQRFPPELIAKLSTECLVMQNHKYGVSPETFQATTELCSFFKILTTSTDQNGKKNAFEWGSSMIPHSDDAIQVTQHVANFFISEARKSLNRPPTEEVLANLIYNYSPTYCGTAGRSRSTWYPTLKGFDEVYIFSNTEQIA
ncbi:hypothetical protein M8C21_004417, partial [Ambrosia artemisiifolia]